jgi:hypothetical protein
MLNVCIDILRLISKLGTFLDELPVTYPGFNRVGLWLVQSS